MRNVIYKDPAMYFRDVAEVHAGVYDYSVSRFVSTGHPITYRCAHHGYITQRAGHHLDGSGCPKCARTPSDAAGVKQRAAALRELRAEKAAAHAELVAAAKREPENPAATAHLLGVFTTADGAVLADGVRQDTARRDGYRMVNALGRKYLAHRIVWLITTGSWPSIIDHIDGDRGNNRIDNLRSVDAKCNMQNRYTAQRHKASKLPIGVYSRGRRFRACIRLEDGTQKNLGTFDTPELAHAAYLGAKAIYQIGATHV